MAKFTDCINDDHAAFIRAQPLFFAARQVVVAVDSVNTSCGFGVPLMAVVGQRSQLPDWAERKAVSFDGLPTGPLEGEDLFSFR